MSQRSFETNRSATRPAPGQQAVEQLEPRQLFAASPAKLIGFNLAVRPDTDGTALNSNRITLGFDRTIRIGDLSKMRLFGYGVDLPGKGQKKVTIGMVSVTRDATDPRVLTIITDRLIRKGSRLFLYEGAITDTKGDSIIYDGQTRDQLVLAKGQNKFRFSLASRAWKPTDLKYFNKETYASAPNPIIANQTVNPASARSSLATFLNSKRLQGTITQQIASDQLARFDSPIIQARVPDANLRAALLSLVGTAGAPAIGSFLDGDNVTGNPVTILDFSDDVSSQAVVAETTVTDTGRLRTLVKTEFRSEPFQSLSAILAHEALHQDAGNTQEEELITNSVEVTILSQQYLIDPSVATRGTQLVTRQNQRMLAYLNSGDALFPYTGTKTAPLLTGANVFPGANGTLIGSTPVNSFENWVRREYIARGFESGTTTGNQTLRATLANITGQKIKSDVRFNSDTFSYFDNSNFVVTDAVAINMGQILKLTY